MDEHSTTTQADGTTGLFAGDAWFDPIETGIRERVRGFIQELLEQELTAALGDRAKHERAAETPKGYRDGTRERQLTGSFGTVQLSVPRARLAEEDGGTREWRSAALPRYARRTRQVEALIAGAYLAGTNTRRVKRALAPLFKGAVGKDVVSRPPATTSPAASQSDCQEAMAEGMHGLDRLEPTRPGRRGHCAAGARRHGRARKARPKGDQHLVAGRARGTARRAEGAAVDQEHGRSWPRFRRRSRWNANGGGKARRPGEACWTTWLRAACARPSS